MGYIYCRIISASITSCAGQFVTALAQQVASREVLYLIKEKKQKKYPILLLADFYKGT